MNDPLEREADHVMRRVLDWMASGQADLIGADTETTTDAGAVQRSPTTPLTGAITRIRRSSTSTAQDGPIGADGGGLDSDTASLLNSRIGCGRAMDPSLRTTMEPHFGRDFGAVRMHDDTASHDLNRRLSAQAFTVGNDIFLSGCAPPAGSRAGQGLMAHELAHVAQQGGGVSRRITQPSDPATLAKRMSPHGNPKSDPPSGAAHEIDLDDEEYEDLDDPAAQGTLEAKTKAMSVAVGRYRASHDRVHRRKQAAVAKNSRQLTKLKGRVAIAASDVARGGERLANRGKHGVLNTGRPVGRFLGAAVKPNTSITMAVGANTTSTATGAYGAVDTEFIEPTITVKLVGTTWHPILSKLKGTYGKITAPLPAGLTEVTGPDANDSKQQIKDLLRLDGASWYMVKAVLAHESIHEDHLHDALNNVGGNLATLFSTLTVDKTAAPTAKAAIAAIKAMPAYDAIVNAANPNDSQMRGIWDAEYVNQIGQDHFGPTQDAEADVVEPMINKINAWRKKQKQPKIRKRWKCIEGNSGNTVRIPKGRKNP